MNQKKNYNEEMENLISRLDYIPNLLLHSCCAPCSTAVINRLKDYFNITIIYYNPNIEPFEEYEKRKEEQKRLLNLIKSKNKLEFIDCDYDNEKYHEVVKNNTSDPEGGPRCYLCYKLRLVYTYQKAKELNYDYFGTTLTVSPFKNATWINEIGEKLEDDNIKFLYSDFKKKNGYKESIEFSREYGLYRQDYCGCIYSKKS